jgi:WD40 repeat protein
MRIFLKCVYLKIINFKDRFILVGGSEDGQVCVWDLQSQSLISRNPVIEGASCITVDYHEGLDVCAVSGYQ